MSIIIRSSKHILKFSTKKKIVILEHLFDDYRKDVGSYVDLIIKQELPLEKFLSSKLIPSFIIKGGQYKALMYKHASEIVRSQIKKSQEKRYKHYQKIYSKSKNANKFIFFTKKKFKELKLKDILISKFFTKPNLKNISITFDHFFMNLKNETLHFDEFIEIKLPYVKEGYKNQRINLRLPIKQHKHSLKFKNFKRKEVIRLTKSKNNFFLTFIYEKEILKKVTNNPLGIDIGYKKLLTCSNKEVHGKNLEHLYHKLAKKQRGSKNYQNLLQNKENEINRTCNSLDLTIIDRLVVEDLKNVKHKSQLSRKFNNKLQYWSYKQVLGKLEMRCEENGILLTKVDPAYTSQTCSRCGVIDKKNRKGELYQCSSCNLEIDADYNASINILHRGVYSPSTEERIFQLSPEK